MHLHPSSQQKSKDNVISGLRGCASSPANVFFYSPSLEKEGEGKAQGILVQTLISCRYLYL